MYIRRVSYNLRYLFFIITCCCINPILAQITVQDAPVSLQFISRNPSTNQSMISFTGYSMDSISVSPITLKRYENGVLTKTIFTTGIKQIGYYHFSITDTVAAKLTEYGYKLYNSQAQLIYSCDSVVVGDVYLVNGQSNAEAASITNGTETANLQHPFIRCFGNGHLSPNFLNWHKAQGDGTAYTKGNIGQWGIQFAHRLIDSFSVPICLLNGAEGGKSISYFKKDSTDITYLNSNYGNLQYRVYSNHLKPRAMIWSQGENDAAIGSTYTYYYNALQHLIDNWTHDYPTLENIYIFQTSAGCIGNDSSHLPIIKSQVNVTKNNALVHLISTNDIPHAYDNCHYNTINGYDIFAQRLFYLVGKHQYQNPTHSNITSPFPKEIFQMNDSSLIIFFKEENDLYTITDSLKLRLTSNSKSFIASHTYLHKNALVIDYKNNVNSGDTLKELNLLGNRNHTNKLLMNGNAINVVNFSASIQSTESVSIDDILNACQEGTILVCLSKTGTQPVPFIQMQGVNRITHSILKNKDTLMIGPGEHHFRYLTSRNQLLEYVDTVIQQSWSTPLHLLQKSSHYLCEEKSHSYNLVLEGYPPFKLNFRKFMIPDSIEHLFSPINLKFSLGAYQFENISDRYGCELVLQDTIQVRYDSSEVRIGYNSKNNLLFTDYNAQMYTWKNNVGENYITRLGQFIAPKEGDYQLVIQIENCIYESKTVHVSKDDISLYLDNQQEISVQIFDVLGRFIRQETILKEQINTYSPANLIQGMYCIVFVDQENKRLETKKISTY